jgi:hypothetical protein
VGFLAYYLQADTSHKGKKIRKKKKLHPALANFQLKTKERRKKKEEGRKLRPTVQSQTASHIEGRRKVGLDLLPADETHGLVFSGFSFQWVWFFLWFLR